MGNLERPGVEVPALSRESGAWVSAPPEGRGIGAPGSPLDKVGGQITRSRLCRTIAVQKAQPLCLHGSARPISAEVENAMLTTGAFVST